LATASAVVGATITADTAVTAVAAIAAVVAATASRLCHSPCFRCGCDSFRHARHFCRFLLTFFG
jgi:hypothetical protein